MADTGAISTLKGGECDMTSLSSAAQSSPTFTQSSSSSPPEPATPPRTNRSRTRYPDLGREAGYKETRIFTPETERTADRLGVRSGHDDKRLSMKDGMEAVVGFFAGLIPNATANRAAPSEDSLTTSPQEISPPASPLAQRYVVQRSNTRTSYESSNLTSSVESLTSAHQPISRTNSLLPPSCTAHHLQKQPSRNSISHQSNNTIASPRPSRAGAYLRHMSSIQTMPERPSSTPVHLFARPRIQLNDSDSEALGSAYRRRGNGEGEGDDEPPLPPSWLETVARAVLFGGNGAYVGGPAVPDQPRHASGSAMPKSPRVQVLRPTRSSLSQVTLSSRRAKQRPALRSGLSDQTNASTFLAPPALFFQLERGRAERSEGQVSKTRVMCRSAPGSRSGSITDRKERFKDRGRDRRKRGDKDRLPSLARTQTEGDVWSRGRVSPGAPSTAHRSDDDEGELDLARILVPPKRQNSIKSLRKHLHAENAGLGGGAHATLKNIAGAIVAQRRAVGKRADAADWDGEMAQEWGAGWVRKGRASRGSEDDDMESFTDFVGADRPKFGSGRSGSGKTRMGFNSAWGLTGS
ncbi:hypothetical protein BJ912DRAFT_1058469 [Pholiota molesta]|nr:hypothetical protein BJ912DRAFT_1058469 [Pholiota molesta]